MKPPVYFQEKQTCPVFVLQIYQVEQQQTKLFKLETKNYD